MAKNFNIEVIDPAKLQAEHPDAIKTVTIVRHVKDQTRLYELASAAFVFGKPLPGVRITRKSDGKVLEDTSGKVAVPEGEDTAGGSDAA